MVWDCHRRQDFHGGLGSPRKETRKIAAQCWSLPLVGCERLLKPQCSDLQNGAGAS